MTATMDPIVKAARDALEFALTTRNMVRVRWEAMFDMASNGSMTRRADHSALVEVIVPPEVDEKLRIQLGLTRHPYAANGDPWNVTITIFAPFVENSLTRGIFMIFAKEIVATQRGCNASVEHRHDPSTNTNRLEILLQVDLGTVDFTPVRMTVGR